MKKIGFILLFLSVIVNSYSQNAEKGLDPKLFGSWNGSEKDNQKKGLSKSWIMHRFEDGTFVLLFTNVDRGKVYHTAEKGKWWVENGVFHELHFNSGQTDTYTYIMIDKNNVKFKAKYLSQSHANVEYEFIDTKLNDDL